MQSSILKPKLIVALNVEGRKLNLNGGLISLIDPRQTCIPPGGAAPTRTLSDYTISLVLDFEA
jgi:hypothetical protein